MGKRTVENAHSSLKPQDDGELVDLIYLPTEAEDVSERLP